MKKTAINKVMVLLMAVLTVALLRQYLSAVDADLLGDSQEIQLPQPQLQSSMSVAEALEARRSQRRFTDEAFSIETAAQLCWAAQGITNTDRGFRTAPSAGAIYPITVYIFDHDGVYEYLPTGHVLREIIAGDMRSQLQATCMNQRSVGSAAMCMVMVMDAPRITARYGDRAKNFCFIEAGHIAQNVLLQATDLGLGAVPIGAMNGDDVADLLDLPEELTPIYILALGVPAN